MKLQSLDLSTFLFLQNPEENDRGQCLLFSVQSDGILPKGTFL